MQATILIIALAALIHTAQAQTSATVLVQDSTYYGSAYGLMSTSFVGLKLPSGGGSVHITITPGDYADTSFVTSYSDHTQEGPYYWGGSSTSFSIGATGHYWVYLAEWGSTWNYDWLEVRVEASTFQGTVTCTYCSPPSGWTAGYPPFATHQETGLVPVSSQPGPTPNNVSVPRWVIPVLAVVIALAVLVPISYCVYRRRQNKAMPPTAEGETQVESSPQTVVEMQTTTSAV